MTKAEALGALAACVARSIELTGGIATGYSGNTTKREDEKMLNPALDPQTGRPLPFAQQPREFQINEAVKGITGFVLIDRSALTLDEKVDWYVKRDPAASTLDAEAQNEIREKILLRVLAGN